MLSREWLPQDLTCHPLMFYVTLQLFHVISRARLLQPFRWQFYYTKGELWRYYDHFNIILSNFSTKWLFLQQQICVLELLDLRNVLLEVIYYGGNATRLEDLLWLETLWNVDLYCTECKPISYWIKMLHLYFIELYLVMKNNYLEIFEGYLMAP